MSDEPDAKPAEEPQAAPVEAPRRRARSSREHDAGVSEPQPPEGDLTARLVEARAQSGGEPLLTGGEVRILDEATAEPPDTGSLFKPSDTHPGMLVCQQRLVEEHTHPGWETPVTVLLIHEGAMLNERQADLLRKRLG